jgi:putative SbcD/Mre11-related phosphoesterase
VTSVEPIPGARAAVATAGDRRSLVIADYHAGVEAALRDERGVHVPNRAADRRERLFDLVDRTRADRLVVCGDLTHSIGGAGGAERGEVEVLIESLPVSVTVAKGNHDGGIEDWIGDEVTVTPAAGARIDDPDDGSAAADGGLGVVHGHAWPATDVLDAAVVCVGHEHPHVRIDDGVGGRRVKPAWVHGSIDRAAAREGDPDARGAEAPTDDLAVVLVPAFNEQVGGTWVNDGDFISPFLPDALRDAEAYLLDGTRLGDYRRV